MKYSLFVLFSLFVFSSEVFAETQEEPELAIRFEYYYANYSLNEDSSHVESHEWAKKILKERAVEGAKRASITYSTSVQKADVVEAYTRKADGRRIDVPPSNFQVEVNSGKDKNTPAFSDQTTLTVVFPEVAVGDTVVFSYKVTQLEAIFPKQFSVMGVFPKLLAYDDVRITIDAPSALWAHYAAREMAETTQEKDGRKVVEWTFRNSHPIKSTRKNYSVYDVEQDPGYAFSTFRSYAEIAQAYGERALPKAAVTERIQKLADEITKDKETPREQAGALYDWVATNIHYAGNSVGVGSIVPHDLSFVLDNKMGDCKDHATLLQALLAAKGIKSTQALINASNVYRLPKIPVVSTVNHVLNYIPSLELFVDSTSEITPFNMLPLSSAGKPVLLVEGFQEGAKTPNFPVGTNQQAMKSTVEINPDGSLSGDVEVTLKGLYAVLARARLRHMAKDQEEDLVKDELKRNGYEGTGTLDKEDPTALLDTYSYKVKFELKNFLQLPGVGALNILPLLPSEAPISYFLGAAIEPAETVNVACSSGVSVEEYTYHFPKDVKILSVPEDMTTENDFLSYRSTARHKGNTLTVKRIFDDKTPGIICPPEMSSAYKKFASTVLPNVKAQVVYK